MALFGKVLTYHDDLKALAIAGATDRARLPDSRELSLLDTSLDELVAPRDKLEPKAEVFRARVLDLFGIDVAGDFCGISIPHPFMLAPGTYTHNARQVRMAAHVGWAGIVSRR